MQNTYKQFTNKKLLLLLFGILLGLTCCFSLSCSKINNVDNKSVEDIRGKKINLNIPIRKVVSAHNPTLNHLIILGNGTSKYIIGFGRKDIANNLYSKILPDWDSLEIIGNDSTPVNKETILNLNPDLIILPEYNWQTKEKDYEGTNIPTFVCFPKKESIESVTQSLSMLANLFSQQQRADTIISKFFNIIDDVKNSLKNIENKPKTAFLGPRIYTVASSNMIQNQIIETAGGSICTPNDLGDHFVTIEPELLLSMNPDYILIPAYAEYSVSDVLNDPKLTKINAVINKNVFKFPSDLEPWDMPTCSSALGVAWLANKLHPECYSKEKLLSVASDFYQLLYNHKFSQDDFELN